MALTTTIPKETITNTNKTSERKTTIGSDDVLMGRGARATENEGNVRFRTIVRSRLHDYLTAPRRQDKDQIAREILGLVKSRSGRFLRKVESLDDSQNGCDYVAVEDEVALLKVKQALRDQKLEESNSQGQGSKNEGRKTVSPTNSQRSPIKTQAEASGLLSPGNSAFQPVLSDRNALLLRLVEQARAPVVPRATYPAVGALAARLALADQVLAAGLIQQQQPSHLQSELLLRASLLSQSQYVLPNIPASPLLLPFGQPAGDSLLASAEARLKLLEQAGVHSSLLQVPAPSLGVRVGGFQEAGDLLEAQRLFKRHKAN